MKALCLLFANINNFHSLEVVDRVSETQRQACVNVSSISWWPEGFIDGHFSFETDCITGPNVYWGYLNDSRREVISVNQIYVRTSLTGTQKYVCREIVGQCPARSDTVSGQKARLFRGLSEAGYVSKE